MTSPVSIGDALLLGKIAFRLGQAFTSGRKSAPAEFREVENQLYSLSVALSALHKLDAGNQLTAALGTDASGRGILETMLVNCEGTLSHLKNIVDEYTVLNDPNDPDAPTLKRWGRKLAADMKKIKWTTEGGSLATLRSQLMVHLNSINAVLGVLNNTQVNLVQDTLIGAVGLLREIKRYITDGSRPTFVDGGKTQVVKELPLTGCFFELGIATKTGEETLCAHALLNPDWDKRAWDRAPSNGKSDLKLFVCACRSTPESPVPPHMFRLNSFSLTPFSFAIRLVDQELSWIVYKVADQNTVTQVSLTIRKLSPTSWLDFHELFVQKLAINQARSWLSQNTSTTLAFIANDPIRGPEVRVLNLLGDISVDLLFVEAVSFSSNGHTYRRLDIDDIQITHYVSGDPEYFHAGDRQSSTMRPADFAEILIHYGGSDPIAGMDTEHDVVHTTLLLRYDTKVEYRDATVTFPDIQCASADMHGEEVPLVAGRVVIAFSISSAAHRFYQKVQQTRAELSIIQLRLPRLDELVVMKLQVGGVHTEEIAIAGSDITIARNTTTSVLRLIITSHDGRTVVSQNLSPNLMDSQNTKPSFRFPTWVVHMQDNGRTRKTRYPNGFEHLALSDVRTNNLFHECARSQLWQARLPFRRDPLESNEIGSV